MFWSRFGSVALLAASFLIGFSQQCSTDNDCNLNGICFGNKCTCDAGWKSNDCGALDLYPASRHAGYNHTGNGESTWGAHIVQDPRDTTLYHLFYSSMEHNCGLLKWIPYSRIMRAESRTGPEGPYRNAVEIVSTFSHNPTVVWSPVDKQYLLYHIGCPQSILPGCNSVNNLQCPDNPGGLGISVHASKNLRSWDFKGYVLQKSNDSTAWDWVVTNPSAWPLHASAKDPTMILAYRGKSADKTEMIGISVSRSGYKGPYEKIDSKPIFDSFCEDPFLWRDRRGNYHMLVHSMRDGNGGTPGVRQVGRHAYARSYKGPWTFNNNTLAYDAWANFTDGTFLNFGRRERPQLFFSNDGRMTPLLLSNGVQEKGSNQSYSIITPIGHRSRFGDKGCRLDSGM